MINTHTTHTICIANTYEHKRLTLQVQMSDSFWLTSGSRAGLVTHEAKTLAWLVHIFQRAECWRSLTIISRRQLDQKIMRVCISYTHLYPIKSLNHTLPFRKCKLYFRANMQVASTLWPDIKSQKLLEHRFRLKWPSVAQEPSSDKSRQTKTNIDQTKRPRTACWTKLGAVSAPGP